MCNLKREFAFKIRNHTMLNKIYSCWSKHCRTLTCNAKLSHFVISTSKHLAFGCKEECVTTANRSTNNIIALKGFHFCWLITSDRITMSKLTTVISTQSVNFTIFTYKDGVACRAATNCKFNFILCCMRSPQIASFQNKEKKSIRLIN